MLLLLLLFILSQGRGECVCSKCVCAGNWTGDSCGCTKEKSGCLKDGVRRNKQTESYRQRDTQADKQTDRRTDKTKTKFISYS